MTALADALAWLDSHVDFESNMPRRRAVPTLDRMQALTALLGEPQESIPSIHVTGTNGKGSTTAMATSLLLAKGLTVGTYTSPNLHAVAERLAHNGEPIDDASLTDVLTELALLEPLLPERPTRFELLTAAALSWFSTEAVDAMVVEVGLGGTWDGTNVVHGDVAVLTNVSFDHTDVLGPTLEGIATDKAGIIEPGSRVVVGEMAPELADIVTGRAREVGAASVWLAGRDFGCESNQVAVGGRVVTLWTPGGRYEDVLVPLHGAHQGVNASVALAAVEAFFGDPLDVRSGGGRAGRRARAGSPRGVRPAPPAARRRRAQRRGHGGLGCRARQRSSPSTARPSPWSGCCRAATLRPCSRRWRRSASTPSSPASRTHRVPCRSPLSRRPAAALGLTVYEEPNVSDALRVARGMVDADGLVVVAGSLYVVGTARADALAASVPWEEAGR